MMGLVCKSLPGSGFEPSLAARRKGETDRHPVTSPALTSLREHVRLRAKDRPGVYRMADASGDILYVGKSVRVRTRLLSYFNAPRGEKAERLMRAAHAIEWEYVPSEFAALLTELRLIQHHRPPYNVRHARHPQYCFVKLTREPALRLVVVTRAAGDDAVYFGPFPGTRQVGRAVLELSRALGLRDCPASTPVFFADQLEIFSEGRAPRCLRGELGSCLAPCAGRPTAARYSERARMAEAVSRLDFEYAGILRDRVLLLQDFRDRLGAWRGELEGLTFLYRVPSFRGEDRLYLIRRGRVREELEYPRGTQARACAAERVAEVFRRPEPVRRRLDSAEAAEILFVASWFRARPRELGRTRAPGVRLEERRAGSGADAFRRGVSRSASRRGPAVPALRRPRSR